MLDLIGTQEGTPFRRPSFAVGFATAGGGGGLLGGALDLLTGGGSDPWVDHLLALEVEAALGPAVDWASIRLADGGEAPEVALGDSGNISLGYEDSGEEAVMGAAVEGLDRTIEGMQRITAVNGGAALSRLRINQSYEQQSAGDIVNDLAAQAEVESDTVESGADFAFLALDDRSNAYEHIAALALRSGYTVFFTTEGKLYFGPWPGGQPVQTFHYGDDVLALEIKEALPAVAGVRVVGEGAAGSQGQDAWSWLLKDPEPAAARAGAEAPARQVGDAALRSAESAQSCADARAHAAGLRATVGSLLVPGAPAVTVASTIEIAGAPRDELNGTLLVRRLRHSYSKQGGFVTRIEFSRPAEAGGGLGGLL